MNYQTAYVTAGGADRQLICDRLIPSVDSIGTVVKLVVVPRCENCMQITESKTDSKM